MASNRTWQVKGHGQVRGHGQVKGHGQVLGHGQVSQYKMQVKKITYQRHSRTSNCNMTWRHN